jgi:hypothetical protein
MHSNMKQHVIKQKSYQQQYIQKQISRLSLSASSTRTGTSKTENANEGTSSRKHEKTTVDHEVKHATNRIPTVSFMFP